MLAPNPAPLYLQVIEHLRARMAEGEWKAGDALPSEFALAAQIGVSQGTVRKALNQMASDNLIDRRQGKGTYMPEQSPARALYHFFRLVRRDGTAVIPALLSQTITRVDAAPALNRTLNAGRRKLWKISRLRAVDGRPALVEFSFLDPVKFPGLSPDTPLPNALYSHYQSVAGHTVTRAEDILTARAAPAEVAGQLALPEGAPLMLAERTAWDLSGHPIEVRQSWILTSNMGYRVDLK